MAAYPSGPADLTTGSVPSRWGGCNGSLNTPPTRNMLSGGGRAGEGKAGRFSGRWHYWVIAGGGSGPGARPTRAEWVRALRDQCQAQRVAFFFKQWGGRIPKAGGNTLDGRQWLEYPEVETGQGLASTPTPRRQFTLPPVIPSSRQT